MKHKILPVFIPFAGCSNQCIFCDQHAITGISNQFDIQSVNSQIQTYLSYSDVWDEIAFYGGSFTCLTPCDREQLYQCAKSSGFSSIRVSTRPDCISSDIVDELIANNVRFVELGVQTLNSAALRMNKRPYSTETVFNSIQLLSGKIPMGVQVMPGMYGDSTTGFMDTVCDLLGYGIKTARIYPTCIYSETELNRLRKNREYRCLELYEAVMLTAYAYVMFNMDDITVIRMGLPVSESGEIPEGPIHTSFGDLVKSFILILYCNVNESSHQNKVLPMAFSGYKKVVAELFPHFFDKKTTQDVSVLWRHVLEVVQETYFESYGWYTERTLVSFAQKIECKANNR